MTSDTTRTDPLTEAERADLYAALDDEYLAQATYAQVMADFGQVRPFSNIIRAEARHAEALVGLLNRYGVAVPPDTWPGRVPRYESLHAACEAAVQAEIENGELYDRLIAGTDRADILEVYRNLQAASQERHLVAFRRCSERRSGSRRDRDAVIGGSHRGQHRQQRRRRRRRGRADAG